ncbi:hypothetical protein [Bdellovibrio reynosensis]|uniref:Uncharacterized protein n=1 Tax=Bdellovibrio reynosensis TaxID=2835041 RepID=A0ABY4C524_9BACT|nr:hypothetical protein [Bdellovibrio reynosensis]UOE99928.1 hypothetical protein MNR06_09480 [Bdellovibrio reynosensis]
MKLIYLKLIFLFFGFLLPSVSSAQALLGQQRCMPAFNDCKEIHNRKNGKPSTCTAAYNECLVTEGGAVRRKDGTFKQMYHTSNPDFLRCKAQGIRPATPEFDVCMFGRKTVPVPTPRPNPTIMAESAAPAARRTCSQTCEQGETCATFGVTPRCVPISMVDECHGVGPQQPATFDSCIDYRMSMIDECETQYLSLSQDCSTRVEETTASCDEKNTPELNSASDLASQLTLSVGQASIQNACGEMAKVSVAANAGLAAYRTNCSTSIKSCKSSCTNLVTYVQQNQHCFSRTPQAAQNAETVAKSCDMFESRMNEAQQAIQNIGQTAASATGCSDATFGGRAETAAPTIDNSFSDAQVDCSKPESSSNKVCVCAKNPNDPMCFQTQKGSGFSAQTDGGADSSSRLKEPSADGMNFDGDLEGLPAIAQGSYSSGGDGDAVEGKQGGDVGLGSMADSVGNGTGPAGEGDGAAVTEEGESSGGGGFFGAVAGLFKPSASEGSGSGAGSGNLNDGKNMKGAKGPNLRQFLPGGKYDPRLRGIAGAQGIDGITGPSSDIWKKIQNRYRIVSPSLEP